MKIPLLIIGSGGFAREAYCWIDHSRYDVVGFFTEYPHSSDLLFHKPIFLSMPDRRDWQFLCAIGNPKVREKLSIQAMEKGLTPCEAMIHSSVIVGQKVSFGRNVIVCPGTIITTNVVIASGCQINLQCTIGHDCVLNEYVTLSPGVNVSGKVGIEKRAFVGTNAAIRESLVVGADSALGMGSILIKNLPEGETWVGNPAKKK